MQNDFMHHCWIFPVIYFYSTDLAQIYTCHYIYSTDLALGDSNIANSQLKLIQ